MAKSQNCLNLLGNFNFPWVLWEKIIQWNFCDGKFCIVLKRVPHSYSCKRWQISTISGFELSEITIVSGITWVRTKQYKNAVWCMSLSRRGKLRSVQGAMIMYYFNGLKEQFFCLYNHSDYILKNWEEQVNVFLEPQGQLLH